MLKCYQRQYCTRLQWLTYFWSEDFLKLYQNSLEFEYKDKSDYIFGVQSSRRIVISEWSF